MDPFPYYFPTPPSINEIDSYIEKLQNRIDDLRAFERRHGKKLLILQAEQAKLQLAETHRETIIDNYRIKLPDTKDELRDLSRCIQDELDAIKAHIHKEEEKAIPLHVDDPRSKKAVSFEILFDKKLVEDMQEYLRRINECLAFIVD